MKDHAPSSGPNRQIVDEASAWFVEFRSGDMDTAARENFNAWLRRSPDHIQAYFEIARTYAELPQTGEEGDIQQLVARARTSAVDNVVAFTAPEAEQRAAQRDLEPARARRFGRARAMAVAASAAVVALGAWFYLQRDTYSTAVGEQHSIVLADGSVMELNALSRVRVRFDAHERSVELLAGQALFRVAPERDRAFVVESGSTRIRAVGTQFDVYRKSSGTTVTVVEGRVAVGTAEPDVRLVQPAERTRAEVGNGIAGEKDPAAILLNAGQQIEVTASAPPRPIAANVAAVTAWTQRQLVFENSSLSEVAEEFNRYSARRMVVEPAVVRSFNVSGVYSSANTASLLRFLRAQPGIAVRETANEIRIAAQ